MLELVCGRRGQSHGGAGRPYPYERGVASLESYLAERSEVWDRPRVAGMFYEEWGSRDPR